MKHTIWIAAVLLALSACSKEEQPEAVAEDATTVEAPAPEGTTQAEADQEAATESLEVVEESASVEEPVDEAIVLALAEPDATPAREWKFKEGEHYVRMVPTQPTVGGADKIEVAESFMYSCPHCFTLEPYINAWAASKDPGVRFVRIPAQWNQAAQMHAQIYFTQDVMGRNGILENPAAFHEAVFEEYHRRGNRLTSMAAIRKLFNRFGVSDEDFDKTWKSFEVNQMMRVSGDLVRRYGISSVPTIVVNGKYRTSAGDAGGFDELIELIEELIAREGLR
ncbi:MAG: thiol:disulfide interchange protein DsbA/DsbL [Woeseiaceae bacterium]|jgi:thiol:disulfide interchange protein DsbA